MAILQKDVADERGRMTDQPIAQRSLSIPPGTRQHLPLRLHQQSGRTPHAQRGMSESQLYDIFDDFPRPKYPFPDIIPDYLEQLRVEADRWIDEDCLFNGPADRTRHKRHRFTDLSACSMPYLTYAEQLPPSRYTCFGAILDDYLDHTGRNETLAVGDRIRDCLRGRVTPGPDEHGFYRQFRFVYDDARAAEVPESIYDRFVTAIDHLVTAYADEKKWKETDTPPPLPVYTTLRIRTAGVIPYCEYTALQHDYRNLPESVLTHPHIRRLHELVSELVGLHNDFYSFPRELTRHGDVINIVAVLAREHSICYEDAWYAAMELHNSVLREFVVLQQNLPDFGPWQDTTERYVTALSINIQGCNTWHQRTSRRYTPGAYVEPVDNRPP
ncbi:terpene synthase family protein [Nocardia wallacei]|uniref:terpene synthase family protein n=1 Tax=Nocardia wallacei TaxID=480035 RepID=UPI00245829A5|nr:hypothetical protein [Nocardia wallacei]